MKTSKSKRLKITTAVKLHAARTVSKLALRRRQTVGGSILSASGGVSR
jgi:hypothetical protein